MIKPWSYSGHKSPDYLSRICIFCCHKRDQISSHFWICIFHNAHLLYTVNIYTFLGHSILFVLNTVQLFSYQKMYFLIIYIFLLVNFWFFTLFSLLAVFCISSLTVFTVTHQNTKVDSLKLKKTPKEIIQKPVLICWKLSLTIELRGSAESSVCWFYITENIRISVFCQATVLRLIVSVLFALVLEISSSATNQMEGNGFFCLRSSKKYCI